MSESNRISRYRIQGKFLAINNNFKIHDEFGHDKYVVRSKLWALHKNFTFEDLNGNVLFKVRQRGFHLLDQFVILSNRNGESNRELASIRQKPTFFKQSYKIYSIYGEYRLKGLNMFDHSFIIKKANGDILSTIDKKFFSLCDVYEVQITESNNPNERVDHEFILVLTVALHLSLYDL